MQRRMRCDPGDQVSLSIDDGGQPPWLAFAQRLQSFKWHAASLQRPFVILLDHHSADHTGIGTSLVARP
jgi:hypothetical protein